jgi:hypothetical protein
MLNELFPLADGGVGKPAGWRTTCYRMDVRIPSMVSNSNLASPSAELSQKSSSGSSFLSILTDSSPAGAFGAAVMAPVAPTHTGGGEEQSASSDEEELRPSTVLGEGRNQSTNLISLAEDQAKAPADNQPIQPDNGRATSNKSAGSANGEDSRVKSHDAGGPIAFPPAQYIASNVPLPTILPSAFATGIFGDGLMGTAAQGALEANGTGRLGSMQGKTQSSSVQSDERTSIPTDVLPSDLEKASAGDTSVGVKSASRLDDGISDGAGPSTRSTPSAPSTTSTETAAVNASKGMHDVVPQTLASRLASEPLAAEGAGELANSTGPIPGVADGEAYMPFASSGMEALGNNVAAQTAGGPGGSVPLGSVVAGSGGSNQIVGGKAGQKDTIDAGSPANPDLANAADAGKGKSSDVSSGTSDGSSHGAQDGGQSSQNVQAPSSLVAATVSRSVDGGAPAVVDHAVSHQAAATPHAPDGPGNASRSVEPRELPEEAIHANGGEAVATSGINAAKVMQTMSESEMRVGVNSAEFGNISIRASMSQQQMLAQISLDHGDLSQAISSHISTVQTKLGADYGVQATIQVNHQGSSFSGESGQSSPREQRAYSSSVRIESVETSAEPDVGLSVGGMVSTGNESRLDVRV